MKNEVLSAILTVTNNREQWQNETADKIIGYRSEHGAFKTKEELKQVPSIGEGKFAKLAEQITL